MADLIPDRLGLVRMPQFIPALLSEVTHHKFLACSIAWHYVAERIDKECIAAHVAGEQSLVSVYVIDEAMIEIRSEPFLGRLALQQFIIEFCKVLRNMTTIIYLIVRLMEIE